MGKLYLCDFTSLESIDHNAFFYPIDCTATNKAKVSMDLDPFYFKTSDEWCLVFTSIGGNNSSSNFRFPFSLFLSVREQWTPSVPYQLRPESPTSPTPRPLSMATLTAVAQTGLNLNMSAAELRARLASRKKIDPRQNNMELRLKHEIIKSM